MEYEKFLQQISEFIFVEDPIEKADIIFVPGNRYPQMAEEAARLYQRGAAPYILPSGCHSITEEAFRGPIDKREQYDGDYQTEWEFLKDVLVKNQVPEEAILREDKASYTMENACFSRKVTDDNRLVIKKAILCCKSYHTRRALMYYQKAYPETEIIVRPVFPDGITSENWMETEEGVGQVAGEIRRLVQQFSIWMKEK